MIDILRFAYPNASVEYLISISNTLVIMGWAITCLGLLGLFKRLKKDKKKSWCRTHSALIIIRLVRHVS